jgi:hypothetical protein
LAFDLITHAGSGFHGKLFTQNRRGGNGPGQNQTDDRIQPNFGILILEKQGQQLGRVRPGHPAQGHGGPANDQAIAWVGGLGFVFNQLTQESLNRRGRQKAQSGDSARSRESSDLAIGCDGHQRLFRRRCKAFQVNSRRDIVRGQVGLEFRPEIIGLVHRLARRFPRGCAGSGSNGQNGEGNGQTRQMHKATLAQSILAWGGRVRGWCRVQANPLRVSI